MSRSADEGRSVLTLVFRDGGEDIASLSIGSRDPLIHGELTIYPDFVDTERTVNVQQIHDVDDIDTRTPIQVYDGDDRSVSRLLLLEETEYEIELTIAEGKSVSGMFSDIRESDATVLREGIFGSGGNVRIYALNFGSYVGRSSFDISHEGRTLSIPFEVRSKKMRYWQDYPKMLADISAFSTSLLLRMRSPVYRYYDMSRPSERSRYEEFMVLDYIFGEMALSSVYADISGSKHRELVVSKHEVPACLAGSMDPSDLIDLVSRQLSEMDGGPVAGMYVPDTVREIRSEDTYDTPENRLVKDAVMAIHSMVHSLLPGSDGCSDYMRRRLGEMAEEIDSIASEEWLRDVGDMVMIPFGSNVLAGRHGYREMFLIYQMLGLGAMFDQSDADSLLKGRGTKVHEVYEYWCYTRLYRCLYRMSSNRPEFPFIRTGGRWEVSVKRGGAVRFEIPVGGRAATVDLYYNTTFSGRDRPEGDFRSYSLDLRPDFTLVVEVDGIRSIVNFDAKYKAKPFVARESRDEGVVDVGGIRMDFWEYDIYKMHTYRDAILNSYGSYVLYPGDRDDVYRRPVEGRKDNFLPSVGAVPLVPMAEEDEQLEMLMGNVLGEIVGMDRQSPRVQFCTVFTG